MAIRELAYRLNRNVQAVHSDIHALLKCGALDKTDDGKIDFSYDAVHVDFIVTKAPEIQLSASRSAALKAAG